MQSKWGNTADSQRRTAIKRFAQHFLPTFERERNPKRLEWRSKAARHYEAEFIFNGLTLCEFQHFINVRISQIKSSTSNRFVCVTSIWNSTWTVWPNFWLAEDKEQNKEPWRRIKKENKSKQREGESATEKNVHHSSRQQFNWSWKSQWGHSDVSVKSHTESDIIEKSCWFDLTVLIHALNSDL